MEEKHDFSTFTADILHRIPSSWENLTGFHDISPSFCASGQWVDGGINLRIWVGSPDPIIMQEICEDMGIDRKRFILEVFKDDDLGSENHWIFQTDSFSEVLKYIDTHDWINAPNIFTEAY